MRTRPSLLFNILSAILLVPPFNAFMAAAASSTALPDIVFINGNIITMEDHPPLCQALALRGERIIAVGSDSEISALSGDTTRIIDLQKRTVVPGFIDSHSHWIGDRAKGGFSTPDAAIESAIRMGWTSINEMFVNQARLDELRSLDNAGRLRLRVNAYLPINFDRQQRFGDWYLSYTPGQSYSPRLRIAGIKLFMDHDWQEPLWSQADLNQTVRRAHDNG